jgi:hypothetical protein
MVDVFRTNVDLPDQAQQLLLLLGTQFPETEFSFDLDDCDRILRAEGNDERSLQIVSLLHNAGYNCELLD